MKRYFSTIKIVGILFSIALILHFDHLLAISQQIGKDQIACSVTGLKTTSIHETKAALSYQIKGSAIAEFGICYNTEGNPTASLQKVTDYQDEPKDVPDYILLKTSLRGLTQGTKYFVKAYVKCGGGEVSYSDEVEFSTPKEIDYSAMLNSQKTEYYPSGRVMRKYTLKEGQIDGLYEFYSDSGYVVSSQSMKDGIANGPLTTFYKDGMVQSITNFKDGIPHGENSTYYPDGTNKSRSTCTGDPAKPNCETKNYYDNGGLKSESAIANGELVYAISYDKEGRVTSEEKPDSNISYSYDEDGWKHMSSNGKKCTCSRCN